MRFQGVSLPGFGVAIVLTIVFAIGRNFFDAFARVPWLVAGVVALGVWILVDVICVVSIVRKKPPS